MKAIKNMLAAFGLAAVVGLGGYAFYKQSVPSVSNISEPGKIPVLPASYSNSAYTGPVDFEKAAESAVPSVVHIKTVVKFRETAGRSQRQQQNPFGDFFGDDDMLRRFFGEDGGSLRQPEQKASGSGVIISNDGYIVTNNHVVNGATEVDVTLNDRKNYKAKVIGTDPNTDLALIKIDAKNLPVMPVGNSDDVRLGQWVLAIGYPLNLDVTVTQGIVSAKSRNIGINRQGKAPVEAFIQTDAAVNPGSSGGALVNTNGELIGINTAIASPTGAYAGYAYSIPANLVKKVVGDIMKYGAVQRGYLGISMAPQGLDDAAKKELGIDEDINGVWVAETDPSGAAAEAGIKKGDAITKVNGISVGTAAQLSEQIARQKPGDRVTITVVRNGAEKTFNVTLKGNMGTMPSQEAAALEALGLELQAVTKDQAAQLRISGGVRVNSIKEDGIIADQTNMKDGFVITKVGGIKVSSVDDLKAALNKVGNNFQIEGIYPGSPDVYYYGINGFRN